MADRAAGAREAKARRDACLRDLSAGTMSLRITIEFPPEALRTTSLWQVLMATHGLGDAGTRKVCLDAKVQSFMPLGQLTKQQRARIVNELPKRVR